MVHTEKWQRGVPSWCSGQDSMLPTQGPGLHPWSGTGAKKSRRTGSVHTLTETGGHALGACQALWGLRRCLSHTPGTLSQPTGVCWKAAHDPTSCGISCIELCWVGGFLTTGPPGKSQWWVFNQDISNSNIKEGSVFILAQNASNPRKRLELSIKFPRSFYKHLDWHISNKNMCFCCKQTYTGTTT